VNDPHRIARRGLGVAALVAGAAALWQIVRAPSHRDEARAFTSSEQCARCHPDEYAEWSSSWHARAWSDPEVRLLSNDFANSDCIDCHAPRPVLETGLGQRVLPRAARRGEGVDCIACHALPDGHASGGLMAGKRDAPDAPCRPAALRDLGSPDFCAACHDQHDTTKQWRATDYAARGIGCIECHMKRIGPSHRDHSMTGGHDITLVTSAVEMRAQRVGEQWVIEIENVGAGHHFPTEERSRAGDVFWRPLDGTARPWRHAYRFRSPYRHEDLPDTLLAAHAVRSVRIDGPESSGAIEVALFYALKPYWSDPDHPDPEREARIARRLELWP
jgi:Cytochrome c554 and c-prime